MYLYSVDFALDPVMYFFLTLGEYTYDRRLALLMLIIRGRWKLD